MIEHVSMGVPELLRAGVFYDAILAPLGYTRLFTNQRSIGYGLPGALHESFAILAAGAGARAPGEGWHLAFMAPTRDAVDAFHAVALQHGAIDEGAPGTRPHYGEGYYAAFVRDADGHRLEAVHMARQATPR